MVEFNSQSNKRFGQHFKTNLSLFTTYLNPRDRPTTFTVKKEFILPEVVTGSDVTDDVIETVEEKMKRKHKILKRGCSMIRTLVEMSKNRTSFEQLISWHERIHNLSYPITADNRDCYPPLQTPGNNLMFYKVTASSSR